LGKIQPKPKKYTDPLNQYYYDFLKQFSSLKDKSHKFNAQIFKISCEFITIIVLTHSLINSFQSPLFDFIFLSFKSSGAKKVVKYVILFFKKIKKLNNFIKKK
jgi:hypothetical protein